MKNSLQAENHIFQLFEAHIEDRIGWVFPIQSLVSDSHSFFDNDHFLKYAFVAFYKLCTNDCNVRSNIVTFNRAKSEYELLDFYEHDDVVVIISKQKIASIPEFNITNYMPSLFKFGYCIVTANNYGQNYYNSQEDAYREVSSQFAIRQTSEVLKKDVYINELFQSILQTESHPLVRFLLLYQVIEVLIENIFQREVDNCCNELKAFQNGSPTVFHKLREKLIELAQEKRRINKLFIVGTYIKEKVERDGLKQACQELIKAVNPDGQPSDDFTECFYTTRSLIVHEYRRIAGRFEELIKKINLEFEKVVIALVISFK